jgi:hypothetical protein
MGMTWVLMWGKHSRHLAGALVGFALVACGGKGEEHPRNDGASGNGGIDGGGSGGGGATPERCVGPTPAPASSANGRVDIPIRVTVNASPLAVGAPAMGASGREYKVSLLKFFLSDPQLLSGAEKVPAQIVGSDGKPAPYGLQLVDAEDPGTQVLRLSAPEGSYSGLQFGVGVPAACNATTATTGVYPLNPDSEMFWTWGSQFLFIRVEGSTHDATSADWSSFFYHVGYDAAYSSISVLGDVSLTAGPPTPTGPTLSLDLDRMLYTEGAPLPSGRHSVPDGWVVDNLEKNQAFTLQ